MGVRLSMTTAHEAQADRQTERQKLVVEDALRRMVSYQCTDWTDYLGTIEYAHSTLFSASTEYSSFEIDTGRKKRSPWQKELRTNDAKVKIDVQTKEFVEKSQKIIEQARKSPLKAQATRKQSEEKS
ncbi:FOG: Transposon-encoded proteins with TYA, reverse transcriptase, integrase domains in various combinations [Plasmopara halstedii]|uniref:FOG: Transposon-encoded proteins with TYA, reverse transcriptase, integrase domains in various combinations n=1 Tax=Plasmopara halstedii TaxID=4781 RepID=A0A0P1A5X8_PLAHL|nr:FOG: Transposon-encoded proteins with TYA, reverse transcriptase, integrase domains in various combinations [Plasmopara halstedii]CEG35799.1 FOG: Transposon-encoded proteins with TYA, reverse transcriptase, integrase domains in various combinations [Plasmopara halstedii]|eukprot:XP_024572168.1 FOG: Transposon-encoded proteins with TYA, reverse transcriptase, integrase domains in various combinations [Plasmopara halstedii]